MNENSPIVTATIQTQLGERAAKLTENGTHYLIGWLISAGIHQPEVMAGIEEVLADFETDPRLRNCETEAAGETAPALQAIETEAPHLTPVNAFDGSGVPTVEKEGPQSRIEQPPVAIESGPTPSAREKGRKAPIWTRFVEAISGKPSVAA